MASSRPTRSPPCMESQSGRCGAISGGLKTSRRCGPAEALHPGNQPQTGLTSILTPHAAMMRTIMAGLAKFERDLIRDRVKSGLAAARARHVKLGRQVGQRPSDKKAKRVLGMHADGLSYRLIARNVGLSKNTVMDIVRRNNSES